MKTYYILLFTVIAQVSYACPSCNKGLNDGIYNESFYSNLFLVLSPFLALSIILAVLFILSTRRYNIYLKVNPNVKHVSPVPLIATSMILGIGLGGLIDGIVLHQILQWHEMFSNKISPTDFLGKSINMYWDGIFHAFCFAVIFTGIILLWKLLCKENVDRSGKILTGGLLSGWGLFNSVEGIINHHILKLHNVQEVSLHHDLGNSIFLIVSLMLIISGYAMIKKDRNKIKSIYFINHLNF